MARRRRRDERGARPSDSAYLREHSVKNSREDGRFVSTRRGPGRSRSLQGSGIKGALRGGGTAAQRAGLMALGTVAGFGAIVAAGNKKNQQRASRAYRAIDDFLNVPRSERRRRR
jgi:hypothetical protein